MEIFVELWKLVVREKMVLRLEACAPLHEYEIDETINPIDTGFQKIINWDNDFINKSRLLLLKDKSVKKSIVFQTLQEIQMKFFWEIKKLDMQQVALFISH
jgi:glycine cleavage system aminomethyltransferase T